MQSRAVSRQRSSPSHPTADERPPSANRNGTLSVCGPWESSTKERSPNATQGYTPTRLKRPRRRQQRRQADARCRRYLPWPDPDTGQLGELEKIRASRTPAELLPEALRGANMRARVVGIDVPRPGVRVSAAPATDLQRIPRRSQRICNGDASEHPQTRAKRAPPIRASFGPIHLRSRRFARLRRQ